MNKNLIFMAIGALSLSTFIYFGFNEKYSTVISCNYSQEKYVNAVFEEDSICNGIDQNGKNYTYSCTETTRNKISDSFFISTLNGDIESSNVPADATLMHQQGYFYTESYPYFPSTFESDINFSKYEFIDNQSLKVYFKTEQGTTDFVSQSVDKYGKCLTDVKEKTLMRTKYFYNISYKVENAI